jgi:AraC family transcriptional regulator, arabinose operon regulatory protein
MNHIRYVDHNAHHPSSFEFDQPKGHDCYLLLLTHTPAVFWVEGKLIEYPKHSVILYSPGSKIYYHAVGGGYENDWLRFDSDELYVSSFPIKNVPFPIPDPEYCHSLFCLLTWENYFPGQESTHIINQLIRILFTKLYEATLQYRQKKNPAHYNDLIELRKRIYKNPELPWKVSEMAAQLHLSPGYFQKIYRETFDVSCAEDVIACRIRVAMDLLKYTDKTVAEVAEECGYNSVEHFCRQFKKNVGKTPGAFRKQ